MNKLSRGNQILAAVLIVQIILAAVVLWPRGTSEAAGGQPLFGEVEVGQIAAISITDSSGNQMLLAKRADGWVMPDADDYPVKGDRVAEFLDVLVALKDDRLVTETAASQKRLKVADDTFERLIEFVTDDGTQHTLYLGTAPSYGVSHVRAAGRNDVYLVSKLTTSTATTTASSWLDTVYFSVPAEEITAVTIENGAGTLHFSKDEGGAWSLAEVPEGETADENTVGYLNTRVDDIRLMKPLGKVALPEYGIEPPKARVTIEHRDAEGKARTYNLTVGAQDPTDKTWVMKSSESPYFVRVSEYTAKDFVNWTVDDFLVKPTPTPTQ